MLSPIMKIFAFAPLAFFFLPFFLSCFLKKKKEERISYEMLSDQYEITTKVALFQGTDKEQFRDRKEFTGSILKQLEDVYQFIDLVNKTKATFSGLNRTDKRDYPEEAVREALLNSIVLSIGTILLVAVILLMFSRIELSLCLLADWFHAWS